MSRRPGIIRTLWLSLALSLGLPATSIVFAHGGEIHEPTEEKNGENTQAATDSTPYSQASREAEQEVVKQIAEEYEKKVKPIFKVSCYDCHSDQTNYPWYYRIPIVRGMIDKDIAEAKKHLNFAGGFPFQGHGGPREDLTAIKETLEKNEMPPWNYKLMHPGSRLDEKESKVVGEWINDSLEQLHSVELPK